MIQNIANRVVSDGIGSFQAAGQIVNQVYQRIVHEAIRGVARSAIAAMKNHRGYRTAGLRLCQRATEVVRQSSSDQGASFIGKHHSITHVHGSKHPN